MKNSDPQDFSLFELLITLTVLLGFFSVFLSWFINSPSVTERRAQEQGVE